MSSTVLCILSTMARDDAQVNFRIPHELNERLKAAALGNNRSVTAELVNRLQRTLDEDQARGTATPEALMGLLNVDETAARVLEEIGAMAQRMEALTSTLRAKAAESADKATKKPARKKLI